MEPICVDCNKTSPPTRTEHTLLSAEHGWRLHKGQSTDGTVVMQWRCPTCWRNYKRGQPAASPPPSSQTPTKEPSEAPAAAAGLNSPRSIFRAAVRLFRNSEPPRE
jgi:hypothetical protein